MENDVGKAMRQKYWGELDTAEKVERMREITHRIQRDLRKIDRMMRHFYKHQHSVNGAVLIEASPQQEYGEENDGRRAPTDVYF